MLAIIGGTGLYNLDELEVLDEAVVETPYGRPSAAVIIARYKEKDILFLPRHGKHHELLPHEINYRANIYALKTLGARQIISVSAVGSLKEEIRPGDLAVPTQYFDWIRGNRIKTFFGDGVAAHISTAQPTCPNLTDWITNQADIMGTKVHSGITYACVDGPRLGTKSESNFLRQVGCDLVGMTNIPEVFLAREAQICYATIGIITDYDCWMEDPSNHVTVDIVIKRYGESLSKVKALLLSLLEQPLPKIDEDYRTSLRQAVMTPDDAIPKDKQQLMEVLRA